MKEIKIIFLVLVVSLLVFVIACQKMPTENAVKPSSENQASASLNKSSGNVAINIVLNTEDAV